MMDIFWFHHIGILWGLPIGGFIHWTAGFVYGLQLALRQQINKLTRVGRQKCLTIWKIKLLRTVVTVLPMSLSIRNWTRMHTTE